MAGDVQMKLIVVVLALSLATAITACSESKNVTASSAGAAPGPAAVAVANVGDPARDEAFRAVAVAASIVSARNGCDLLTQADAEAAVGQALPKNKANLTLGYCAHNSPDFSAGARLTVGDWESIKSMAVAGSYQPQAISGVGDEALWLEVEGNLYVRKGNEGFSLSLYGPKINPLPDKGLPAYKSLALRILAHY